MSDLHPLVDGCDHRLMIFTPYSRGHHGSYVRRLLEAWITRRLPGTLDIVVDDQFAEIHADMVALAQPYRDRVRFIALSEAEVESIRADSYGWPTLVEFLRQGLSILPHIETEWRLICRYAEQCGASHIFVQYMNHTILGLAAGLPTPCPVSGIFHDLILGIDSSPEVESAPPLRQARVQELFAWKRILRHPQLHTLFVLDMFGAPFLQALNAAPVVYLPAVAALPTMIDNSVTDGSVTGDSATNDDITQLRAECGIEPERSVFLLFGSLDSRKGVPQTLQALSELSIELARRTALVIAGRPRKLLRAALDSALPAARRSTSAQIITDFEYLPESSVATYFRVSDVVLLPYQQFSGTSGVLMQAALFGKPVIASDYGWICQATRHFGLGLTIDTSHPAEIASAMSRFLQEPVESLYDKEGMERLARKCNPESFDSLIFSAIYGGD